MDPVTLILNLLYVLSILIAFRFITEIVGVSTESTWLNLLLKPVDFLFDLLQFIPSSEKFNLRAVIILIFISLFINIIPFIEQQINVTQLIFYTLAQMLSVGLIAFLLILTIQAIYSFQQDNAIYSITNTVTQKFVEPIRKKLPPMAKNADLLVSLALVMIITAILIGLLTSNFSASPASIKNGEPDTATSTSAQ